MFVDQLWGFLLGYAFGSVPFGLILAKLAGKGDIRKVGSGNIGATNVLRTGSKPLAAAVLLLDLAKGFAPVWLAWQYLPEEAVPFAAVGAVIGHCFPVWLGFRGGKGVATNAGVAFGIALEVGLAYAVVWLAMLAITRISSVAGMSAVIAAAVAAAVFGHWEFVNALGAIAVLIVFLHRANIKRLVTGTEPKVGGSK